MAKAFLFAGALLAAGCAAAGPAGARASLVRPPSEVEPDCVARAVRAPAAGQSPGRGTFEFQVGPDGVAGPVEAVSWAGAEGDLALTNEVARAIARCAWAPGTVDGKPARVRVVLPLRFAAPDEAGEGQARPPLPREEIAPPRESAPGCVSRTLPLPAGVAGAVPRASFLVQVRADGTQGAVSMIGRPVALDEGQRRALADEVAAALSRCRLAPGTVNGVPAPAVWIAEVRFAAPGE